jgi:2-polyprenyl-3-methyl-5-hydroxy-6-metoxy-1,4-benzoquinol methylase
MKCILCGKNNSILMATEVRDGKANVFYCKKCDLAFLDNSVTENSLKEYYDDEYRKTTSLRLGSGMKPKELFLTAREFQDHRLGFLKKFLRKDKKLLDVGCSSGMFLWHAKKYVKEVVGIDYDSNSAKFAAKICSCKTYSKSIQETGISENYFDIICAFQTLEHVGDPIEFISQYKRYLKPGGIIAIEVPNLRDPLLYLYEVPHYQKFFFHKSHLWYFTKKSLEKLMDDSGFKGKAEPLQEYNILNHMGWIYTNAPQSTGLAGLRKPILPIRKSIIPSTVKKMNEFIQKVDSEYRKKLYEVGLGANLFYIGKK